VSALTRDGRRLLLAVAEEKGAEDARGLVGGDPWEEVREILWEHLDGFADAYRASHKDESRAMVRERRGE
jgi:hypothetical protein